MESDFYETAVLEHKDRVYSYARAMLRNTAEAEDVAQEVLVRLWHHRKRVDVEGVRLWLVRATHNLCIDLIRKRKVRCEVADGESVMEFQTDKAPGPQTLAESGEIGKIIERSLGVLRERDRAVVLMREVQGMPYDEIAEVLGVPLGTIKARLHRARERLRAQLVRAGVTP